MDQVESVATWIGLATGIAGIVLAIVTIWFATNTDRRSGEINDKMIQALEKIESTVDRTSRDTQDLIKSAWERMLIENSGTQTLDPLGASGMQAKQVAAGMAAEIRAELATAHQGPDTQENSVSRAEFADRIGEMLSRVEAAMDSQMQFVEAASSRRQNNVDLARALAVTEPLGVREIEAIRLFLTGGHLSIEQYQRARENDTLRPIVSALRASGIFIPLRDHGAEEEADPVYWFPPGLASGIKDAIAVRERARPEVRHKIRQALMEVGYLPPVAADSSGGES